jgi:hypothetical protein
MAVARGSRMELDEALARSRRIELKHGKDTVTSRLRAARWIDRSACGAPRTGQALILLALPPLAACTHSHSAPPSVPVYAEVEPNDDPISANYFGRIRPGDHFFIDGWIDDRGFDPFDGFAFTAEVPLHVDFQLWIDDPFADLDVCLYDPQLGLVLDCFQTASNPERGGVDALAGGLDFHLVVESYSGRSSYALEISVTALYAASAALPGTGLTGTDARRDDRPEAAAVKGYAKTESDERDEAILRALFVLEIDPRTGEISRELTFRRW